MKQSETDSVHAINHSSFMQQSLSVKERSVWHITEIRSVPKADQPHSTGHLKKFWSQCGSSGMVRKLTVYSNGVFSC